jgi:hypothetical protein
MAKGADVPATDDTAAMAGKLSVLSFTERSPLSSRAELVKRLSEKIADEDYDLGKEAFLVYVPKEADAKGKVGLIYLFNYKDTEDGPEPCYPVFDEAHVVFVTAKQSSQADWMRCGLAVDAVHNLKKSLKVDEKRVYAIDGGGHTLPGERCVLGYPEVFTGSYFGWNFEPTHQIRVGRVVYDNEYIPRPPAAQWELAKQRAYVFAVMDQWDDYKKLVYQSFQQDGFKRLKQMRVDSEQYHYPNYSPGWLKEAIAFWDAAPAPVAVKAAPAGAEQVNAPPAAAAANPQAAGKAGGGDGASAAEAQRIVNLAKSYISAQRFEPARTRLNAVVQKYPDTPAAKEAKELLDQIKGK